jgi:hypothetical protein
MESYFIQVAAVITNGRIGYLPQQLRRMIEGV